MEVTVIKEAGYEEALYGLSLSYNSDINRMSRRAALLAPLDKGHNKYLESVSVWIKIKAPRYFWQQFDTYRVGITKQSESTMHTIMRGKLTTDNFTEDVAFSIIDLLNHYIESEDFEKVKANLPEGFLQERLVCTNYKVLRNMYQQRKDHKLEEWKEFISLLCEQLTHKEWIYG